MAMATEIYTRCTKFIMSVLVFNTADFNITDTVFSEDGASLNISVYIIDDDLVETDESFYLILSSSNPSIAIGTGNASIIIEDNEGENINDKIRQRYISPRELNCQYK